VTVAPLNVAGEVGDMLGDNVIPLALACPEADAHDGLGVVDAAIDAVFVAAHDRVLTLGLACPEADAHVPLGVADPSAVEVGDKTPDGDPVIVCPLHVIRGVGETLTVLVKILAVACADPVIPLGLPVGVEGRVGVTVLTAVDDTPGE